MSERQPTTLAPVSLTFGPQKYGVNLYIDDESILNSNSEYIIIDVETDEKEKFVGLAISDISFGSNIYYFSKLTNSLKNFISTKNLIGHNIKFDAHQLLKWGIPIKSDQLYADTMLMSYVDNPTKESHGLKDLAKEMGIVYPSYKEMVGKGRKKVTLDKQEIEKVANYCGMDVYVTGKLFGKFLLKLNPQNKYYLNKLELPTMRILFGMENEGIMVDDKYLWNLYTKFSTLAQESQNNLLSIGLKNPRSPKQVKEWLNSQGIKVDSTDQRFLKTISNDKIIALLKYREQAKLLNTYIDPLIKLSPRVHTTFNQVTYSKIEDKYSGIRTGRLSSSYPNLHNIPVRTDNGKLLRKAFIAKENMVLICADYSQIEYRLLAHFSDQEDLIEAFKGGKDIHEETGRLLGCDRKLGKTLNFASIYGAGAKKISQTAGISEEEATKFLGTYWRKLSKVRLWIDRVKQSAIKFKGIKTILGHWIPLPGIDSNNPYERYHWERAAVNYIIQGSAAEIIKLAMIKCKEKKYDPILQIHDELLFELPNSDESVDYPFMTEIRLIMESAISLKVPLIVDVGIGKNWSEAKGE